MSHWRSGTFWASFIFGWVLTFIACAVLLSVLGSEQMTGFQFAIFVIVAVLLSLVGGYAYGRKQYEARELKQIGFPVIMKEESRRK